MLHDLTQLGFLRRLDGLYQAGNVPLGEWLATGPTQHTPQGGVTNQVMRKVAQERVTSLYRQLITHHQALNHLRVQAAKFGISIPTHIQLDIDEHLSAIADIETELAELGENITPFHPPQSR
jgi:hypothetical protein